MKELKPVFDAANKITSERVSPERERELFDYLHPIKWMPCSNCMPPNDDTEIILKDNHHVLRGSGITVHQFWYLYSWQWIPYDEATWRGCCLPVSPDNKL